MTSEDNDTEHKPFSAPRDAQAGAWTSLEAWKALPSDPDLNREFGYELTDWEVITQETNSDQLIFLPADQDALADDAFIVAAEHDICDVINRR